MQYNPKIALAWFEQNGLAGCVTEHKFHPERRWQFDFAWPDHKVALEVEGGVWIGGRHNRGAGFKKDMEKYNAAASLGWRVLRVEPRDLCLTTTVDLVRGTLHVAEQSRRKLERYGNHLWSCATQHRGEKCDCGFLKEKGNE